MQYQRLLIREIGTMTIKLSQSILFTITVKFTDSPRWEK